MLAAAEHGRAGSRTRWIEGDAKHVDTMGSQIEHGAPRILDQVARIAYPEWDCDAGTERPDWTTVRAAPVLLGDAGAIDAALDKMPALRARVRRLVRGAKVEHRATRPDDGSGDADA